MAVPEFRAFSRLPVARVPMVGPWFTTPWRLVFQSHGAVAWRFLPSFPLFHSPHRDVPLPHSVTGPIPASRGFPFSRGCGAALATPFSPSRPLFPSLIMCFYPSGPQSTQWRGPTGSSFIQARFVLLARVAPIQFPCPAFMVRSLDQSRMILSGASGHISHVEALLAYLCIGTRTQRLYAAVAPQGVARRRHPDHGPPGPPRGTNHAPPPGGQPGSGATRATEPEVGRVNVEPSRRAHRHLRARDRAGVRGHDVHGRLRLDDRLGTQGGQPARPPALGLPQGPEQGGTAAGVASGCVTLRGHGGPASGVTLSRT